MVLEGSLGSVGLVVSNVLALPLPAELTALVGVPQRVRQGPHALRVRGVRLHEIAKIEPVSLILPRVLYPEVVPLRETLRAVIILEE